MKSGTPPVVDLRAVGGGFFAWVAACGLYFHYDKGMWLIAIMALAQAQSTASGFAPTVTDAQRLSNRCSGPMTCTFACWDAAVRLMEPTDSGGVRIACYTQGESHGPMVSWHPNGRKEGVGYSQMGVPIGGYIAWHENGRAAATGTWQNGQLYGQLTTWHENGQLQSQGEWQQGVQVGVVRHWHDNGQLDEVGTWKNQKPDGPLYSWYKDGQIKAKARYADGQPHGMWKQWYPNGKKEIFARYEYGTLQSIRCWADAGKQVVCPNAERVNTATRNQDQSEG